MLLAQREEVGNVGRSSIASPVADVVCTSRREPHAAIGMTARGMKRGQCPALTGGRGSAGPPEIQRDPVATEHDREDVRVTREAPDRARRQRHAVDRLAHGPFRSPRTEPCVGSRCVGRRGRDI